MSSLSRRAQTRDARGSIQTMVNLRGCARGRPGQDLPQSDSPIVWDRCLPRLVTTSLWGTALPPSITLSREFELIPARPSRSCASFVHLRKP
jgi:hypothetical protein